MFEEIGGTCWSDDCLHEGRGQSGREGKGEEEKEERGKRGMLLSREASLFLSIGGVGPVYSVPATLPVCRLLQGWVTGG